MSNKDKNIGGWMGGAVVAVALVMLITVSVQNGSIKGLNGRDLMAIEPAGGEEVHHDKDRDHAYEHHDHDVAERDPHYGHNHSDDYVLDPEPPKDCGIYEHWVGKLVDRAAVEATGKVHRIIPLGSMITMDHNPERINVYLNKNMIVLDVRCG